MMEDAKFVLQRDCHVEPQLQCTPDAFACRLCVCTRAPSASPSLFVLSAFQACRLAPLSRSAPCFFCPSPDTSTSRSSITPGFASSVGFSTAR